VPDAERKPVHNSWLDEIELDTTWRHPDRPRPAPAQRDRHLTARVESGGRAASSPWPPRARTVVGAPDRTAPTTRTVVDAPDRSVPTTRTVVAAPDRSVPTTRTVVSAPDRTVPMAGTAVAAEDRASQPSVVGRRTVTITGRGSERGLPMRSARPPARRRPREHGSGRPERIAMWAVLLGIALAIGAATSSHGAVLEHVRRALGH
jgi:hypothetical protein